MGQPHARTSRVPPDAGRRGDDRPARPGHGQRRRHGDRRALPRAPLQPARPHDRRPPHVRARLRRRPDGGHLLRGRLARRTPRARQADLPLRRQPRHARRPDVAGVHRGRAAALRGLRLAGAARRERATRTSTRSTRRSATATSETERPSIILVRTTIGYGSPHKAGTQQGARQPARRRGGRADQEGARLGVDRAVLRSARGAATHFRDGRRARDRAPRRTGSAASRDYAKAFPDLAAAWRRERAATCRPAGTAELPSLEGRARPSRRASPSRKAINAIARSVPWLIGGDADLSESTKTTIEGRRRLRRRDRRRAATSTSACASTRWAAIANGMAYHGGVRPFVATFFCFSDYMRPSVRLAALNELPVIFVWTHDSIGLGEDGPTHQPVEHLMSLRAIPHLAIMRPGDANETAEAWRAAIEHRGGPVGARALAPEAAGARPLRRAAATSRAGAYVLAEASGGAPRLILIATGSEAAARGRGARRSSRRRASRRASSRCRAGSSSTRSRASTATTVLPPRGDGAALDRGGRHVRLAAVGRRPRRLDRPRPLRRVGAGGGRDARARLHRRARRPVREGAARNEDRRRLRPRRLLRSSRRSSSCSRGLGHTVDDFGDVLDGARPTTRTTRGRSPRRCSRARATAASSSAAAASEPRSRRTRCRASAPRSATTRSRRGRASRTTT